jgi:hypothetical protein
VIAPLGNGVAEVLRVPQRGAQGRTVAAGAVALPLLERLLAHQPGVRFGVEVVVVHALITVVAR